MTQIKSLGKTIKRESMHVLNPGDKLNVGILRVGAVSFSTTISYYKISLRKTWISGCQLVEVSHI